MRQEIDLRHYQQRIATFLYEHDAAFCVIRPGGGKTIAALTAIVDLLREGVIRHALILAPKRVCRQVWPEEIAGWAHTQQLQYQVLSGPPKQRELQLDGLEMCDLTICGLDIVDWLLSYLRKLPLDHPAWDMLVIDEISKLRDPTGKRAKLIAAQAYHWRVRWGMSGTLRPNSAQDLFMPARIITKELLWGRSFYAWKRQHFYATDYMGWNWAPLPGSEATLNAEIAPYITTLGEDELPQLPPLQIVLDRIELSTDARRQYDTMQKQLLAKVEDDTVLAASTAIATGKLAQLANGWIYDSEENGTQTLHVHDEKKQWLKDLVEDANDPVLLVYEYRADLTMLREVLGNDLPYLGSGVTDKQSDQYIADWNAGKLKFLAIHPKSGGHGLNLQLGGASDIAWIAPCWSPESWEQTIARLYRSGQQKSVVVRVCVASRTVDELKLARVHDKIDAQTAFEAYLRQQVPKGGDASWTKTKT